MEFSHIDEHGNANMVDVSEKDITVRTAQAQAVMQMNSTTLQMIKDNSLAKGDVLSVARIAGICAAKKTSDLIPLCHAVPIEKISVDFEFIDNDTLLILAFAKCSYKTGIEMEALTAASVAALTVYDMCKAVDRSMIISDVRLLLKTGGRSGSYSADGDQTV